MLKPKWVTIKQLHSVECKRCGNIVYQVGQKVHLGSSILSTKNPNELFGQPNIYSRFTGGSVGKESACNAGDLPECR